MKKHLLVISILAALLTLIVSCGQSSLTPPGKSRTFQRYPGPGEPAYAGIYRQLTLGRNFRPGDEG